MEASFNITSQMPPEFREQEFLLRSGEIGKININSSPAFQAKLNSIDSKPHYGSLWRWLLRRPKYRTVQFNFTTNDWGE